MNLAFHASDRGSNPSLATIFYFYFLFFFAFVVFILIFFSLFFFIFNRIDNPPTSAFRYKFPKGSKYSVLFTEIQPFLELTLTIMQTSPCNEYPLKPHFYIVKLGFTGIYIFFLFLLYNIDRGCCLDIPMMEVNEKLRIRIILSFFLRYFINATR